MIRKIGTVITLIIILINASCVYSETNKAFMKPEEVREYMKYMDEPEDVQRAREAIFNSENKIEYTIDTSQFKEFFIDKKYSPKQKFRNADFHSDGRYVLWHSHFIALMYFKGELEHIICTSYYINHCPALEFDYDNFGNLKYISYSSEQYDKIYIFDKQKNYVGYCKNLKCYDKSEILIYKSRPYIPYNN